MGVLKNFQKLVTSVRYILPLVAPLKSTTEHLMIVETYRCQSTVRSFDNKEELKLEKRTNKK